MFIVTVKQISLTIDLYDEDTDIFGTYLISDADAVDEETALDYFHDHIGIRGLEDFEITCEGEISTTDSRIDACTDI